MNDSTDPIFGALDRLARVVDSSPVDDPMPAIARKTRANRRRAVALTVGGLAAAVVAGFGVVSAVELADSAREPEIAGPPTTTPVSETPTPNPDRTSPNPDTQEASPESPRPGQDLPTVPGRPDLVEYERMSADVDGDGTEDVVRVTFPVADASSGLDSIVASDDVRLHVERGAGGIAEIGLDQAYLSVAGTRDLDEDGTAEVVLSRTEGGDSGWVEVFTWDGETLAEAIPADGSPIEPTSYASGVYGESFNTGLREIGLISWRHIGENRPPYEVQLWTWGLDGTQLVATEAEQIHCMDPDQYRVAGSYPTPC